MISTGEISGDRYGAALAKELWKQDDSLEIIGVGHQAMKEAGVDVKEDMSTLSTVGFTEIISFLPKLVKKINVIKLLIKKEKPDIFVAIDAQGLHMILLKLVKEVGGKTVYYIAPQEWQWGTKEGGKKVLDVTDKVLAIFEKEANFYKKLGGNVSFVGHPLIDVSLPTQDKVSFYEGLGIEPEQKILGVFPGSRWQEIKKLGPVFFEVAAKCEKDLNAKVVISVASETYKEQLEKLAKKWLKSPVFTVLSSDLIAYCHCSIVSSGTVTLEHAIHEKPCVVAYKFSPITYAFGKTIMARRLEKVPYMSLPNLMAKKRILPEFLQSEVTVTNLSKTIKLIWENKDYYATICNELKTLKKQMSTRGVVQKVAKEILAL